MDTPVHFDFASVLEAHNALPLSRTTLSELQINMGYLCNQACEHCHVEAGPKRTELMNRETMERIIAWAADNGVRSVDITGGAPELNPNFRWFCDQMQELSIAITSRCNITVQFEDDQQDLPHWYAERKARLVCSLPCYSRENVDQQRGKGVFGKSIAGLQAFNAEGYGRDTELVLDLVYNPVGASLPPDQKSLENEYKMRLSEDFGIEFNTLLTLTNLPVKRFRHFLKRTGQLESYQQLLLENFNPNTIAPLMCRHLVSVDWRGYVYDCDFNQMLDLPMAATGRRQLWELKASELEGKPIALGSHCFGCTAGAGSSCGGALT